MGVLKINVLLTCKTYSDLAELEPIQIKKLYGLATEIREYIGT